MHLSTVLGALVSDTKTRTLPADVTSVAKKVFLDCLGSAIGGSRTPAAQAIQKHITETQATGQCTIIGFTLRAIPEHAALANGAAAHALDIDDTNKTMSGHPSVAILPVTLALGETLGSSGEEVLTAYVLGFEVEAKVGKLVNPSHCDLGWHTASTLGTLGAAAAACYMLRLPGEQASRAIGIAASMACGIAGNFGSMVKPLHAGLGARNGVLAAGLARAGLTSQTTAFEAPMGFFRAFAGLDAPTDLGQFKHTFGNPYDILRPGTDIKLYPSCNLTHCAIDGVLDLIESRPEVTAESVQRILCATGRDIPYRILHLPRTADEGRFSLEFCLATALDKRQVLLSHFSDSAVVDPRMVSLMRRCEITEDPVLAREGRFGFATSVTLELRDGTRLSTVVERPKGSAERPLTTDELHSKFTSLASKVLADDAVKHTLEAVQNLERLPDIRDLTQYLQVD